MNSNTRGLLARAGAAAAAAVLATPTFALAEGVGADILIPKPAEFIPALIAFLIIWIVLAKLVWPQVLQMMDKRQQKIQDDLDAAAKSKQEAAEQAKGRGPPRGRGHHRQGQEGGRGGALPRAGQGPARGRRHHRQGPRSR